MRSFIDDIYDQLRSARTDGYHDGRYNQGYDDGLDMAIAILDMLTVRCKDCKLHKTASCAMNFDTDEAMYCSYAERRQDG